MDLQITVQLPQGFNVVGRVDGRQILQFLHVVSYDEVFSAVPIFQQLHSNSVVSVNHSKPFQVSLSRAPLDT